MREALQSQPAEERLERERDFHNARFEHDDREAQLKYYDAIADCFRDYWARVDQLAVGAHILEYGCAYGDNALRLATTARTATGLDISDVALDKSRQPARHKGSANVRPPATTAAAQKQ